MKIFLGALKSEMIDPKDRKKAHRNIPKELMEALLQLTKIQKDREIVIKRCDKGAGVIILNFKEYISACNPHLGSTLKKPDGSTQQYYTKVDKNILNESSNKLKYLLQEGLDNNTITKADFEAMDPEGKKPSKFYCTFKIHKPHEPMKASPERPIVSPYQGIQTFLCPRLIKRSLK